VVIILRNKFIFPLSSFGAMIQAIIPMEPEMSTTNPTQKEMLANMATGFIKMYMLKITNRMPWMSVTHHFLLSKRSMKLVLRE